MPEWAEYVRRRLDLASLRPERVEEIVEDLGHQLEDAYQEALADGATEADARTRAERHIADWQALAADLRTSPRERLSPLVVWDGRADDRVIAARGRLTTVAHVRQDVVYGLRALRRTPGVTAIAALSLALGIGANTAVFSVTNALLLRPLPVEHPEQLVVVTDPTSSGMMTGVENGSRTFLSYHEFEGLRDHNAVLSALLAFSSASLTPPVAAGGAEPARAAVTLVSGNYFGMLGLSARQGQVFGPEVDQGPGGHPVAVVSDAFWRQHLGADPAAIGRTIRIRQTPFDVVAIMPPTFIGLVVGQATDIWVPITMQQAVAPGADWLTQPPGVARRVEFLHVVGRLRPTVTLAQANANLNLVFQQGLAADAALIVDPIRRKNLVDTFLDTKDARHGVSELRDEYQQPLLIVMTLVGLLLLLACANVANMLLARASGRSRELAVRVALGATRARLVRQLLTESVMLAGLGASLGLLIAEGGTRLLLRMVSGDATSVPLGASLDGAVLTFTLAVTLVTGLLFGLAPALRATRPDLNAVLRGSTRDSAGTGGASDRPWLGQLLAGAQVAISLVLLVMAGLFVRSLQKLSEVPLGYNPDHLLMFRLDLTPAGYAPAAIGPHLETMLAELRTVPGVERVSFSENGLFYGSDSGDDVSFPGRTLAAGEETTARFDLAGPDYFKTVGIPILLGRDVAPQDATGLRPVWLNASMARYYFKDQSPVGQHMVVHYSFGDAEYAIQGVVADVRDHTLRGPQARRFYMPFLGDIEKPTSAVFQVRYAGDAAGVTAGLRAVVQNLDPAIGPPVFHTVGSLVDLQILRDRITAELSTLFGAFALLLAALGLYGVLSYHVTRRLGEIGVRMALGADRRSILSLILGEAWRVTVIGAAVGLVTALGAARLLGTLLFGLTGHDPTTLIGAVSILFAVATLAAAVPAWRASQTDPIAVLRGQ
jgi:predicted permease